MLLNNAGFDSHRTDPIGSLGLETQDFITLTQAVLAVANQHAGGRIVSVLEAGYNPPVLAECVGVHLTELLASNTRLFASSAAPWHLIPAPFRHVVPSRRR